MSRTVTAEAKRIEILTEMALVDVAKICGDSPNVFAAASVRSAWHGKWQMASIDHGALSLTCMVINRAIALIDAAISHKKGVAHMMPHVRLLYPSNQRGGKA